MMQKSVYCKLALNMTVADAVMESVRRNHPKEGLIQAFIMTEKQFSRMEFIIGKPSTNVLDTDKRLVIL